MFTFGELYHSNKNHKGGEPIIIRGFMGKKYVNVIYVDSGSSTDIMYKQLPKYVQKKIFVVRVQSSLLDGVLGFPFVIWVMG